MSHNKKLQRNKSMGKIKAPGKGNTIKTKKEEGKGKKKVEK